MAFLTYTQIVFVGVLSAFWSNFQRTDKSAATPDETRIYYYQQS